MFFYYLLHKKNKINIYLYAIYAHIKNRTVKTSTFSTLHDEKEEGIYMQKNGPVNRKAQLVEAWVAKRDPLRRSFTFIEKNARRKKKRKR